jgi:hypothetical protein
VVRIVPYTQDHRADWDRFVAEAKTSSFLFYRGFMEYHAERFTDFSHLIFVDDELRALMPANVKDDQVSSHGGLTYGGFLSREDMRTPVMMKIVTAWLEWLRSAKLKRFVYKALPAIYHLVPAEEDLYALFQAGAVLDRRMVSSTIDYRRPLKYQERRRRAVKKAEKHGYELAESRDYAVFWNILEPNLEDRHRTRPTHSLKEILLLNERFPKNVRLFLAKAAGAADAGVVVFETESVAHLQYIAASPAGKETSSLDFVIDRVIQLYRGSKRYFDFGISTEDGGKILNAGLIDQKEGFGARAVNYDIYRIDL